MRLAVWQALPSCVSRLPDHSFGRVEGILDSEGSKFFGPICRATYVPNSDVFSVLFDVHAAPPRAISMPKISLSNSALLKYPVHPTQSSRAESHNRSFEGLRSTVRYRPLPLCLFELGERRITVKLMSEANGWSGVERMSAWG